VVLESDLRAQRRKEFDRGISQKLLELELMQQSMDRLFI